MKTIKSAVIGTKRIQATEPEEQLAQLREILTAHSNVLVDRLLRDLSAYTYYKFKIKLSKEQSNDLRDRLLDLKKGEVDMSRFRPIVNEMNTKAVVYLNNDLFYNDIDELILHSIKNETENKAEEMNTPFALS